MSADKIIMPPTLKPETNSICMKAGVTYAQSEQGIVKMTERCIGDACKLWSVEHKECLERLSALQILKSKASE